MIATEKLWYLEEKQTSSQTRYCPAEYSQKLFADCEIIVDFKKINFEYYEVSEFTIEDYLSECVKDGGSVKDLKYATLLVDGKEINYKDCRNMSVKDGMKIFIQEEIY